ncbi:MAG TPA: PAAR-like domain-containing protein [Sedimentisphaerales bacterium]|nr:PAAR-like domain-containing protein [Sedimentisphaerales bacterium]
MFPATKGSGGQGLGFPDVCNTPAKSPPIPVPYPTMIQTKTMTKTVKIGITSKPSALKGGLKKSGGDEAGVKGGIVSGMIMGAGRCSTSLVTNLMDYQHGQFLPRHSGIVCQMPTCSNAAEAYLPITGQPVCLQCYKTGTKGSYPTPSMKVPILP